ncbi:MAG: competence/damage-inducible protein A [Candidatus Eremiobacteraeota bacterium]|nr:competence/damage-inducible protein A [Candidatus Eremiobacteraeota bacterium]
MPSVELLSVGTELLLGQLIDTNGPYIAQRLAESGIDVFTSHSVGDNEHRISAAITAALGRADGVIATGGLGPTVDDLTKEATAVALALPLEVHEESRLAMREIFAANMRVMRENNYKQVLIPKGSVVLHNRHGTAPGFIAFRDDGKFVACMPGVPHEMRPMLADGLMPWLREHLGISGTIRTRVLRTFGLAESEVDHRIADLFLGSQNPKIAVLAHEGVVDVKLMAKAANAAETDALIAPVEEQLRTRLEGAIFGNDECSLESAIHTLLQKNNKSVSVAESCTGGSVCAALSRVAGASRSFKGGVVAYENSVKADVLGVEADIIERHGAVSQEVAIQMARGVQARLRTSLAVATTGIAGPDGGSADKPVGLVWFAIAREAKAEACKFQFYGDRAQIQRRATTTAKGLLWEALQHHGTSS